MQVNVRQCFLRDAEKRQLYFARETDQVWPHCHVDMNPAPTAETGRVRRQSPFQT
jgi:hypothetical protein